MSDITSLLLDEAAELLAAHGFQGLRMIEVATRAGVSRQTVYNEFGNKEGLVQAVAAHRTADYVRGFQDRLEQGGEPFEALRSALRFTFEQTAQDRLVSAILTGADAEDLLPLMTTRGMPVLGPAVEVVAQHLARHFPGTDVRLCAETTVRLALSHLLLPMGDLDQAMDAIITVSRATLAAS
ncbi:TetR family transcriptional regulator [Lentzea sp. NBRC 105346]|uniref:TetR/AcrR family transcriptional regulator n=1 Tax=Lentzea sp. NBRC 105346 TaxID=3032205 RepID=UPI0024A27E58|nr:TetR family transcriptional regulator [Lentzea sp. NBRC 105346]GLZ34321.1 TetR family transcriptional regulator [Lentzea sp. NBRC 105346]